MSLFKQRNAEGMTLVETVVLIAIYTILMLVITNSVVSLYQTNGYALAQTEEIDNARRGITKWYQDVKEMTVAEDGTYPVAVIEPNRFGYYSDTDQDDAVEYVEYLLSGTTLTKKTYNATGVPPVYDLVTPTSEDILSLYVQNIIQGTSTFFYYNENGVELNAASPLIDVKYVKAQLIVNIDPLRSPGEFMLRSSVAPRNLKDNL